MSLRPYRTSILLGVTFTLLLSTFWYLPQFAFIIFLSLLLNLLLSPLVESLEKRLPRGLAAGLALLLLLLVLFGLLSLVSSSILPTFTRFVTDFPEISEKVQEMPLFKNSPILQDELDSLWIELKDASVDALKGSLAVFISLFSKAIDFVIILFVTFYLLKDGETIKTYLASRFPRRDYSRVLHLFNEILKSLRAYIVSQLIICCITATIVFLYFTMRGLPYASVFAVVSGVSEFIPVLGPTVASAFGTILTATVSPFLALQTIGFYLILTQVNHNLVYPTLIGRTLNLHPIAIILGIILGGELLGPAGMFLAVPFIVICKLVIEDIYHDRTLQREKIKRSRWLNLRGKEKSQTIARHAKAGAGTHVPTPALLLSRYLMTITGIGDSSTTFWLTEPISAPLNRPRPRLPMMIMSLCSCAATRRIAFGMLPVSTCFEALRSSGSFSQMRSKTI